MRRLMLMCVCFANLIFVNGGCGPAPEKSPDSGDLRCEKENCNDPCLNQCSFQETQCDLGTGSVRVCVERLPGCWVWNDSAPCPSGACKNETSCQELSDPEQNDACEDECSEDGRQWCQSGFLRVCKPSAQGCLAWSDPRECGEGFCADTITCGQCQNTCASVGRTVCAEGLLSICGVDENGCIGWEEPSSCPLGLCSDSLTCASCVDECSVGDMECQIGNGNYRVCEVGANDCTHWGEYNECLSGACADAVYCSGSGVQDGNPSCDDECVAQGETQCADGVLRTCLTDALGCLVLGNAAVCEEGFCANTSNCGSCAHECDEIGDTLCEIWAIRSCDPDANGCRTWSPAELCEAGICLDQTTCATCEHQCEEVGERSCNAGKVKTCVADEWGCRDWTPELGCQAGFCASANSCGGCHNECVAPGEVSCEDGALKTCSADSEGCLVWAGQQACADGFCSSVSACGVCGDECGVVAQSQCSGSNFRGCVSDANGCLGWTSWQACDSGSCLDEMTCAACVHQCEAGSTQCLGAVVETCVVDNNGCRIWNDGAACADGFGFCESASNCGVCNNSCTAEGQTECIGGETRACLVDANGCLGWGGFSDCPEGFCGDSLSCGLCDNECASEGLMECANGIERTCTADAQNCLGWESHSCGSGLCDSELNQCCIDECASLGAAECIDDGDGTALFRLCSVGPNGCRTWNTTPCPLGACRNGSSCGAPEQISTQCINRCTDDAECFAALNWKILCDEQDDCEELNMNCICSPLCRQESCGDSDGCGGVCGCPFGQVCNHLGMCTAPLGCNWTCGSMGYECGEVCGSNCGSCAANEECVGGSCLLTGGPGQNGYCASPRAEDEDGDLVCKGTTIAATFPNIALNSTVVACVLGQDRLFCGEEQICEAYQCLSSSDCLDDEICVGNRCRCANNDACKDFPGTKTCNANGECVCSVVEGVDSCDPDGQGGLRCYPMNGQCGCISDNGCAQLDARRPSCNGVGGKCECIDGSCDEGFACVEGECRCDSDAACVEISGGYHNRCINNTCGCSDALACDTVGPPYSEGGQPRVFDQHPATNVVCE